MRDFHRILLSSEVRDVAEEVDRLFEDLDRSAGSGRQAPAAHCTPALDILETDGAAEIVVDLPGVTADAVRVLFKGHVLVVAGDKPSPYAGDRPEATFHVVERGFGRFARAVRLEGAFDGGGARAVLRGGELRVVVPKIVDRREKEIHVPVVTE